MGILNLKEILKVWVLEGLWGHFRGTEPNGGLFEVQVLEGS